MWGATVRQCGQFYCAACKWRVKKCLSYGSPDGVSVDSAEWWPCKASLSGTVHGGGGLQSWKSVPLSPLRETLTFLFSFSPFCLLMDCPIEGVAGRDPVIVMQTQPAAREALLRAMAAHPVPRPVGQCLAVGLGVPPAQGHIPFHVLLLALLARIVSIAWISNPARISWPYVVVLNDKLEIAAGTFKSH